MYSIYIDSVVAFMASKDGCAVQKLSELFITRGTANIIIVHWLAWELAQVLPQQSVQELSVRATFPPVFALPCYRESLY